MSLTLIQSILIGALKGFFEWMPVDSTSLTNIVVSRFYGVTEIQSMGDIFLFLNIGILLSAVFYFRNDLLDLISLSIKKKYVDEKNLITARFIIFAIIISAFIGVISLVKLSSIELYSIPLGKLILFFFGFFLFFTGLFHIKSKSTGMKTERNLSVKDSFFLGVTQGLSIIPGVSRIGISTTSLMFRKFTNNNSVKISFILSIPIIFIVNILLNIKDFAFSGAGIYSLFASFIFGFASINLLMKSSEKIDSGWFTTIFASLMILSSILL